MLMFIAASLSFVLTHNTYAYSSDTQIIEKEAWYGTSYYHNDEKLNIFSLINELSKNPNANDQLSGYWLNHTIAVVGLIGGAGYVGQYLGSSAGGSNSEQDKLLPGLALVGIGMYFDFRRKGQLKNAITDYNRDASSTKTSASYIISPVAIGISVDF